MNFENHVLLITPGFPKDENDFLCTPPVQDFLLKYKEVFPKTKFSVIALQYPYERNNYKWNAIDVRALGGNNIFFKKLFIWKESIKQAKKIHSEFPITTIHSLWFGECALVGNYLSKYFGCNHLCTLMGQDVNSSNKYLRFLNKDRFSIISLSQNQGAEFYKITNSKVDEEIFWGIDEQSLNQNDKREIDLLAVGSLIPLKNYGLFIKVVANAVKNFPNIVCKLVGDGPDFAMLNELAIQSGINKNIELTGLLPRKEIFDLMKKSKIFVHPSKFEGSGFVFAEALANGMNIVSFNVGYAHNLEKWFIANDESDFISITNKLLSSNLSFEPLNIFPISETVEKYSKLYNYTKN
ncbi:MAG: glycosyltransferase [Ignavibacteriales bacterium]|nr:glycosyltransferase [Ignavibacteriales bacterium]